MEAEKNIAAEKKIVAEKRLEAFEKMLDTIQENYIKTDEKMKLLKAEGKEKTATYRQLMGTKLQLQNMISQYKLFGLLDE
ncbi:MAG: hypothetical protein MRZ49_03425 [Lachnospiraceae bacterium]|nr:hypothetical protein [Lachnospiraceae bacterium]